MSGRDKRAPADPDTVRAAELEQLRQAARDLRAAANRAADERDQLRHRVRELHEAAQHAADERRALTAAQAEITGTIEALTADLLNRQQTEIMKFLKVQTAELQRYITSAETKIREGFAAEMAAAGATNVVLRTAAMILHLSDPDLSVDEWVGNLQDIAAAHTVTGCSCLGCLAITMARTGSLESSRDARRPYIRTVARLAATVDGDAGKIMVATPEGLRAYQAAGGKAPDLIIDARD